MKSKIGKTVCLWFRLLLLALVARVLSGAPSTSPSERLWRDGPDGISKWSANCIFLSHNFKHEVQVSADDCATHCYTMKNCTHFSWVDNICFFKDFSKEKEIEMADDEDVDRCGYIVSRQRQPFQQRRLEQSLSTVPPVATSKETIKPLSNIGLYPSSAPMIANRHLIPQSSSNPSTQITMQPTERARLLQSQLAHSRTLPATPARPIPTSTEKTTKTEPTTTMEPAYAASAAAVVTTPPRKWFEHEDDRGQLKWSFNCDYIGNDIKLEFDTPKEKCGGFCLNNTRCNHFSWFNSDCHLKRAKLREIKLQNTISTDRLCGYILTRHNKETLESERGAPLTATNLNIANATKFLSNRNQQSIGGSNLLK